MRGDRLGDGATGLAWFFMLLLPCVTLEVRAAQRTDQDQIPEAKAATIQTAAEEGVSLTVELSSSTLYSGAENYVTCTIRNDSEHPVEYYLVAPQSLGVEVEVLRNGREVETTALGTGHFTPRRFVSGIGMPIQIKKGQEVHVVLNLTRYYDLSLTGAYEIVVMWHGNVVGRDKPVAIRTKPLGFEVREKSGESMSLPKDPNVADEEPR